MMVARKREEVLVIYIKLVIQLVCFYCVTISIFNKEWIFGGRDNPRTSITGSLDSICITSSLFEPLGKLSENSAGIDRFGVNEHSDLPDEGNVVGFDRSRLNKQKVDLQSKSFLVSAGAHEAVASSQNESLPNSIMVGTFSGRRNRFKHKAKDGAHLSLFEQVKYCSEYKGSSFIKEWKIYPSYISFLILIMVGVSMVMSIRLVNTKMKWTTSELVSPALDFVVFTVSLAGLAQILHVLAPLTEYLQKRSFEAYFSTNFFLYSFSIGGFFVAFVLSVGITNYRYEAEANLKRFEEHMDNIHSFNSLIHLVSNSN